MDVNILSIDVEEIFHGEYTQQYSCGLQYRTPNNIPEILNFLEECNVRATFFIVGEIAEKYPEVIKDIQKEGHEVAFHGWDHKPLWKLTPRQFREEVRIFKKLYPNCIGFRAPSFSLNNKTKWALKMLYEEGFLYDSSIFPTWTPLYGVYRAPSYPYYPSFEDISKQVEKGPIIEFPLATYSMFGLKVPIAGGFWLRFWSLDILKRGIKKLNKNGSPAVIFVHNWELDPETPILKLPGLNKFVTYYNQAKTTEKLYKIINEF